MARTPTTPVQAQRNCTAHIQTVREACDLLASIMDGSWSGADADRTNAILGAAKVMEAAGCYVRRVNAQGLIVDPNARV